MGVGGSTRAVGVAGPRKEEGVGTEWAGERTPAGERGEEGESIRRRSRSSSGEEAAEEEGGAAVALLVLG